MSYLPGILAKNPAWRWPVRRTSSRVRVSPRQHCVRRRQMASWCDKVRGPPTIAPAENQSPTLFTFDIGFHAYHWPCAKLCVCVGACACARMCVCVCMIQPKESHGFSREFRIPRARKRRNFPARFPSSRCFLLRGNPFATRAECDTRRKSVDNERKVAMSQFNELQNAFAIQRRSLYFLRLEEKNRNFPTGYIVKLVEGENNYCRTSCTPTTCAGALFPWLNLRIAWYFRSKDKSRREWTSDITREARFDRGDLVSRRYVRPQ